MNRKKNNNGKQELEKNNKGKQEQEKKQLRYTQIQEKELKENNFVFGSKSKKLRVRANFNELKKYSK